MRNNEDRLGTNPAIQDASVVPQSLFHPPQTTGGASAQAPQLNFIVPTEFVQLPSKGKYYPEGHPLHGKDSIEIKQMTAKEEDILTSRGLIKKGVVLDRLVESLILDKAVRVDDLLAADKNAIVVSARVTGYGPEYVTMVTCPNCQEKSKHMFNLLEKLEAEETEETARPETSPNGTFFLTLPRTKWKVELRPLNSKDEKAILKMISGDNKKTDLENTLTQQIKMMVVSIEGETKRDVLNYAIDSMPALDSKFIRNQFSKLIPDMSLRKTFVCSKCSHEEQMEVPITADFFWPK